MNDEKTLSLGKGKFIMVGNWIKKLKANKRRFGVGVLAVFLAGFMGVSLLANNTNFYAQTVTPNTVVDPDTSNIWSEVAIKSNSTENIGRIWTDKSVFDNDYKFSEGALAGQSVSKGDSDFLVSLSALASYSNERSTVTTTNPIDIIMVLDRSGSMDDNISYYTYELMYNVHENGTYYVQKADGSYTKVQKITTGIFNQKFDHWELDGVRVEPMISATDTQSGHIQFYTRSGSRTTRMRALQNAASNFIDSAAAQNAGNNLRIGIVSFSSQATITQELTAVTGNNVDSLKNKVNNLRANGDTYPDRAFEQAKNEIASNGNPNAKTVVLFFTDGMPAESGTDEFNDLLAANAVNTANELKKSKQNGGYDASVYSVCIMEGADPSITDDEGFNAYMNAVS